MLRLEDMSPRKELYSAEDQRKQDDEDAQQLLEGLTPIDSGFPQNTPTDNKNCGLFDLLRAADTRKESSQSITDAEYDFAGYKQDNFFMESLYAGHYTPTDFQGCNSSTPASVNLLEGPDANISEPDVHYDAFKDLLNTTFLAPSSRYEATRKCTISGCTKFSQSNTSFCIRHGGGRRCTFPECTKAVTNNKLYTLRCGKLLIIHKLCRRETAFFVQHMVI